MYWRWRLWPVRAECLPAQCLTLLPHCLHNWHRLAVCAFFTSWSKCRPCSNACLLSPVCCLAFCNQNNCVVCPTEEEILHGWIVLGEQKQPMWCSAKLSPAQASTDFWQSPEYLNRLKIVLWDFHLLDSIQPVQTVTDDTVIPICGNTPWNPSSEGTS